MASDDHPNHPRLEALFEEISYSTEDVSQLLACLRSIFPVGAALERVKNLVQLSDEITAVERIFREVERLVSMDILALGAATHARNDLRELFEYVFTEELRESLLMGATDKFEEDMEEHDNLLARITYVESTAAHFLPILRKHISKLVPEGKLTKSAFESMVEALRIAAEQRYSDSLDFTIVARTEKEEIVYQRSLNAYFDAKV